MIRNLLQTVVPSFVFIMMSFLSTSSSYTVIQITVEFVISRHLSIILVPTFHTKI